MLFLLRLAARLPLRLAHALGAVLGWMVYLCSPRYRKDFKRNLATAGLSDFRLRCSAVAEAGKSVMEVPAVWLRPLERVAGLVVEVSGWEQGYRLQANSEDQYVYPGSQPTGDKLRGQKGNNPDRQLRSQSAS